MAAWKKRLRISFVKKHCIWTTILFVSLVTICRFRSRTYFDVYEATKATTRLPVESSDTHLRIKTPLYTQQESFAACILVLDQNHRLTEWIAYHYFALPLRTLIIAYDPKSKLRASELIQRWKDVIEIIEWEDDDYLPANWALGLNRERGEIGTHRRRQPRFMKECTKVAASKKITRVIHQDVDEYLRVNTNIVPPDIVNTSEPGHVTKFLNALEQTNNTLFPQSNGYGRACSVFSRYHYVQVLNDRNLTHAYSPTPFVDNNNIHFETLRFPYRAGFITSLTKGLIHLKYISNPQLARAKYDVHLPLGKAYCERPTLNTSLFIFNHYIGSYEAFLYSVHNDPRYNMTRDKWEERVYGGGGMLAGKEEWRTLPPVLDDSIVNWVPAFYNWQSEEVASVLLRDTGLRAVLPVLMSMYPNISNSYYDLEAEEILINALLQKHRH